MKFAEKTKDSCLYIISGLVVIILATFTKGILGNITSKLVKLSGIIMLGGALYLFGKELKNFLTDKPDIFTNPKYSAFKSNTMMVVLFVLSYWLLFYILLIRCSF